MKRAFLALIFIATALLSCKNHTTKVCNLQLEGISFVKNSLTFKTKTNKKCEGITIRLSIKNSSFVFFYNNTDNVVNSAPPCGFSAKFSKEFISLGVDRNIRKVGFDGVWLEPSTKVLNSKNNLLIDWHIHFISYPNKISIFAGKEKIGILNKKLKACKKFYLQLLIQPRYSKVKIKPPFVPYYEFLNFCLNKNLPLLITKSDIEHIKSRKKSSLANFLDYEPISPQKETKSSGLCSVKFLFFDESSMTTTNFKPSSFIVYKYPKEKYPPYKTESLKLPKGSYEIEPLLKGYLSKPISIDCYSSGFIYVTIPVLHKER